MTITATRHTAVDFLQPFVRSQLRIAVNNVNGDLGTTPTFYVLLSTSAIQFLRVIASSDVDETISLVSYTHHAKIHFVVLCSTIFRSVRQAVCNKGNACCFTGFPERHTEQHFENRRGLKQYPAE